MTSSKSPGVLPNLTDKIIRSGDQYINGGAFGDVRKCWYTDDQGRIEVAVKSIRIFATSKENERENQFVKMTRREHGIWSMLTHPNVVPLLGVAEGFGPEGSTSLVSLWMPNGTIDTLLKQEDARLTVSHRLRLLLDIANGLHYLHIFPVAHGDLKPNNVLIDSNYNARLADFGLASLIGETTESLAFLQMTTNQPGCVRWSAPEHFEASTQRAVESDIYTFGNMALLTLSGSHPWSETSNDLAIMLNLARGQTPARPKGHPIGSQQWALIQRCWAPINDRPTATSVASQLQLFLLSSPDHRPLREVIGTTSTINRPTDAQPVPGPLQVFSTTSPPEVPSHMPNRPPSSNVSSLDKIVSPKGDLPSNVSRYQSNHFTSHDISVTPNVRSRISFEGRAGDIIIAIMGPTGAGKTNFISTLVGRAEQRTTRGLLSAEGVTPYILEHGGRRFVLVDMPGFDDTYRSDIQILREIADWLAKTYRSGIKLTGIIYLHRITDNRMTGSAFKNLQMFGHVCGDTAARRVCLVTTMWDTARDRGTAEQRAAQLKTEFWAEFMKAGALVKRFENTYDSAWGVVRELMGLGGEGEALLLQEELVDQQMRLNETEAGKALYSRFQELLAQQKETLKLLAADASRENNPSLARSLQEEYDRMDDQLQKTSEEMQIMKITFPRRASLLFFGRKSQARPIKLG